jgi:DNA-binding IclR family transcriptional regulator
MKKELSEAKPVPATKGKGAAGAARTRGGAPAHTVPVLLKALRVFAAIARDETEATAKGLAMTLGISPTTCYRILQSFMADGWLRPGAGGTFALSYRLVPLLRPLLRHELLIDTMREPLAALARETGLTAKLSVRQEGSAVTVLVAGSPRATAITSRTGAVFPLALGSSGAAILASLPQAEAERILDAAPAEAWRYQKRAEAARRVRECRREGFCFDTGSYQPQLHTLSAPLVAGRHGLVGSITLLGFPQDFAAPAGAALSRKVRFTAGGCARLLEGQDAGGGDGAGADVAASF